ncbi:MAG: EAL domain-containing protein [Eubacteriales bacterium]|nr:EAL domain-containing protein [Eubacteriales bacterium]MDD3881361.1 EAL domain-containing protein [Eubacteriales bacterium]MDD4513048.1 EAL domain-containing protein [Eubacteriales bacterium]
MMGGMFGENIRFQLAALCFLLLMLLDYARRKRLKVLSTRFFSAMMGLTFLNLIFDIGTVYTIWHMSEVTPFVNRLCHQLFIGSLDMLIYCLFLYVVLLTFGHFRQFKLLLVLSAIPFITSMLFTVFSPLEYYNDGARAYSYGAMAWSVYICVTIYIFLIDIFIFTHSKSYTPRKKAAILIATLIWIFVAVIQYFAPWLLLSGLGVSMMVMYIYLTFENPNENIDQDAHCFNRRALRLMLDERCGKGAELYALSLVIDDYARLSLRYGNQAANSLLEQICEFVTDETGCDIFRYRGNGLCVIAFSAGRKDECAIKLKARMERSWSVSGVRLSPAWHLAVIACPKFASNSDEVFSAMEYMYAPSDAENGDSVRIMSEDTVKKMHRAETVQRLVEEAVLHDGFEVYYQPIYSASAAAFHSAEALVRMKDKSTAGYVSPDEFIPIAERIGLISKIGETVLDKVCRVIEKNRPQQYGLQYVEVNLSAIQMDDPELAARLKNILAKHGVRPSQINFEVTESVAVASGHTFTENLTALHDNGSSFSIDDFGTGYSNLARVAGMDYDMIKFDKSLIWPCFYAADEAMSPRIVLESMTKMAGALSLPIVAEGVETKEQADYLIENGVEYLQGYLYSRPVPEAEFVLFLQNNHEKF